MAAGSTPLWHFNLKINSPSKGYNLKFHMKDAEEATARAKAILLATRFKGMLPGDCSIFYAAISKDDTQKDSRFVREAVGPGLYATSTIAVGLTKVDRGEACSLVRLENDNGSSVTRKIGPVPDDVVSSENLIASVTDVVGVPSAAPAAWVTLDSYVSTLNKFMQELVLYTKHVVAGHPPGGDYIQYNLVNAYFIRTGVKKGGRDFI